jgi:hypothetical protein
MVTGCSACAVPDRHVSVVCCLLHCTFVFAGVYSVGSAAPKQVLSCAEMAKQRHAELLAQLDAAANKMEEA